MEIKIQCDCGTKYKFDVEPVEGRVPFAVICPGCGIDATELANSRVQELMGVAATAAIGEPVLSATPEPRLRVRVHVPTAPPPETVEAEPVPAMRAAPRQFVQPTVTAYTPDDEGLGPKFFLGLLGALLGVLVGCGIWYGIFHFTDSNFRLMALVVGAAGGFGAKLMSKDEGSGQLGMITCVFVLLGIVFTAYFIGRTAAHNFVGGFEGEIYEEQVAYAKRAVKAVPNGTEEEIRGFLAKEESFEDEKVNPADIAAYDVLQFRDVDLAHYKELASGKISENEYFKNVRRWEHESEVADAKYALASMPNESDAEIRTYLAKEYVEDDEKPDPRSITAEEIQQFRADELPDLKALASGEKQFAENAAEDKTMEEALNEVEEKTPWMKFMYFFAGWGLGGVGIMFITLGMTYKICTHN